MQNIQYCIKETFVSKTLSKRQENMQALMDEYLRLLTKQIAYGTVQQS